MRGASLTSPGMLGRSCAKELRQVSSGLGPVGAVAPQQLWKSSLRGFCAARKSPASCGQLRPPLRVAPQPGRLLSGHQARPRAASLSPARA
eukprot:6475249-Pyramimonas_sp.AAC.1